MTNFDGTRSTIYVNRNSATLDNSDGTSSTINFFGDHSNLIWTDGTQSSVFHNGSSSRINNPGGKQFIISHRKNRSSFLTTDGAHAITHFFGNIKECRYIDKIDVLIHMNWLVQKKAANAALNNIGTIE
ncbi:MAG: hypothetical protein HKO89_08575 [Saprospiraceae bacterium]|nr:hypothetical protein [Saprospiraceae bacterium]